MLTSRETREIEHPDEPGIKFTLRKLSYGQVLEAEKIKRDDSFEMLRSLGDIKLPETDPEKVREAANNPDAKYDRATVLRHGITAWTYDAPCDDANKSDLDEKTASWLFAAIITHSLRSADQGEASGSNSTPISA